jgi:hypothetical protein
MGRVAAEQIHPIDFNLPTDAGTIRAKCAKAYKELSADRQILENREGAMCLATLKREFRESLEDGFMRQCQNTVNSLAGSESGAKLSVSVEVLKTSFNTEYTPYYHGSCLDKEIAKSQLENAQQASADEYSGSGGTGYGSAPAVRESCYAFNGCR